MLWVQKMKTQRETMFRVQGCKLFEKNRLRGFAGLVFLEAGSFTLDLRVLRGDL